jgi:membrane protein DedA with SNARE-associated domain
MLAMLQVATTQSHTAEFLERLWAYLMLGATGIVTEEATPLVGGLAAHNRHLSLAAVGMWVAGGTWLAGIGLYYFGRWRGEWARRRWPRLRRFVLRAFKIVRRHPWRSSLAVRWAYGLRLTLPIACGAGRLPIMIYLVGSAISCLTWAYTFTLLGWGFGRTMLLALGHVRRYENYLIAVILIGLALAFLVMRRKHVEDEVVEVLAAGDTGPIPKISRDEFDDKR